MNWRVIELETHDAYTNMGIDEALLESMKSASAQPTIRLYRWKPSAVSIGRFQSLEKEVNLQRCSELGIDYVRRITGGGAVYHDFEGEITYSVIAPQALFPQGIRESYRFICGWVIKGLANVGIEANFVPINDIIAYGKKISGNAQTRKEGVLLQHGTILYKIDVERMFGVLNISKEKISDKMIKNVEERVTAVSKHSETSIEGLYKGLLNGFTEGKEFSIGKLSVEEQKRAKHFADSVYKIKEWNHSR